MTNNIYKVLESIETPLTGFKFKKVNDAFWGKNSNGKVVFGLSSEDNSKTIIESTKHLSLLLNIECEIDDKNEISRERLNLLILKSDPLLDLFINLTTVFIENKTGYSFLNFFLQLKELFSMEGKVQNSELQGLFGELFVIYFFKRSFNLDISNFYQSTNKMKFDFSVSETKKIEVKTTLKQERIHHFKNEQLNNLRYDIKIISLMMQKDDKGLSLLLLIERCKNLFSNNLTMLLNIEKIVKTCDVSDLESVVFNENHLIDNLKIYDSAQVPKIQEKTVEGIFNIEFDSNLTNSKSISQKEMFFWVQE